MKQSTGQVPAALCWAEVHMQHRPAHGLPPVRQAPLPPQSSHPGGHGQRDAWAHLAECLLRCWRLVHQQGCCHTHTICQCTARIPQPRWSVEHTGLPGCHRLLPARLPTGDEPPDASWSPMNPVAPSALSSLSMLKPVCASGACCDSAPAARSCALTSSQASLSLTPAPAAAPPACSGAPPAVVASHGAPPASSRLG